MSNACPTCGMHWLIAAILILFGIALGLIIGLVADKAQAHSWYEPECCSGKDCREVSDEQITFNSDGSYTYDGLKFTKDMVRPSRDGKFHVCIYGWGGEDGSMHRRPTCLYEPTFY